MKAGPRVYDPEHDAIWTAIRRLTWCGIILSGAVILLAITVITK